MTGFENIAFDHPDYMRIRMCLLADRCPDCDAFGFEGGPRGGLARNIFCKACGSGFNIAPYPTPEFIQRIGKRER